MSSAGDRLIRQQQPYLPSFRIYAYASGRSLRSDRRGLGSAGPRSPPRGSALAMGSGGRRPVCGFRLGSRMNEKRDWWKANLLGSMECVWNSSLVKSANYLHDTPQAWGAAVRVAPWRHSHSLSTNRFYTPKPQSAITITENCFTSSDTDAQKQVASRLRRRVTVDTTKTKQGSGHFTSWDVPCWGGRWGGCYHREPQTLSWRTRRGVGWRNKSSWKTARCSQSDERAAKSGNNWKNCY